MNWQMVTALFAGIGILITLAGIVYLAGGQKQITDNLVETVKEHSQRLNDHDADIAKLNFWKDGFDAGKRQGDKHDNDRT